MKALIIGGGIAGTVTALALHKAGIDAEVCEAETSAPGGWLVVAAHGLDALRTIDAHERVIDHGSVKTSHSMFRADGERVAKFDVGGRVPGIEGPLAIRRDDLYRVLREQAEERGIPVKTGKRLTAIADGVATFADGSRESGDLIVGADGVHSTVRAIIDPDAPAPRRTGLHTVCGHSASKTDAHHENFIFQGAKAYFGYTTAPDGQTWWYVNTRGEPEDLAGLFAEDGFPAVDIIRTSEEVTSVAVHDIPKLPKWHRDEMIVVGDAAHAPSPAVALGASTAMEDGVVLAKCLRDIADIGEAFVAYEALRRERVERIVEMGAERSQAIAPDPEKPTAKPSGPPAPGALDWLYRFHIDWDSSMRTEPASDPHKA